MTRIRPFPHVLGVQGLIYLLKKVLYLIILAGKNGPPGWSDFEHCTGIVDCDIEMYCFYTENEEDKTIHDDLKSLAVSEKND